MAKVYFARHQAQGTLWDFPFAERPSDAQLAALNARCAHSHGVAHPKTGEPYWLAVLEVQVMGAGDMPPSLEASGVSMPNGAEAGQFAVTGSGSVINKE